MKRRGADAQPNTEQRRERASNCLREHCDLSRRPDWSVLHRLYLRPNLSCALQGSAPVQFDAARVPLAIS